MKIHIVAHDAGGAELVAAWVRARPEHSYEFFLSGPAVQVFQRRFKPDIPFHTQDQIESQLRTCDRIITAGSWGSDIAKNVWIWAKRFEVHSVLYVEGWGNFKNTFLLKGKKIFPSQIWATNDDARKALLEVGAPRDRIEIVPNFYLKQVVERIHEAARGLSLAKDQNRLLYCCENISSCESTYENQEQTLRGYDEFEALRGFLKLAEVGKFGPDPIIRVRPHPSENISKYRPIIDACKGLLIESSSPGSSLESDMAWATQVVGCETMALAVAIEAGKSATSCIPQKALIQCRLPHKELIRIQS